MKEFSALPQAESCRLIDFAKCEVRPGFLPDTYSRIRKVRGRTVD
jgi:hypothetical protein